MISKDKEYTTRDGREVRIYATDAGGDEPIHGAVRSIRKYDVWNIRQWDSDGRYLEPERDSVLDLIEKPKTKKVWIEVWMDSGGDIDCQLHTNECKAKGEEQANKNNPRITHLEIIEREYPVKTEE